MRNARGKGWRFFEWVSQKILPEPCVEHSPYIESEKRESYKSVKKVDIPVV
jgi:hypothetical protein